jgi:acetate kinase
MASKLVLTFNAGSSGVKIGIFDVTDSGPKRIGKAVVDFSDHPLKLHLTEGPASIDLALSSASGDDLSSVVDEVFRELGSHFDLSSVVAAGHRIVHGGDRFDGPVELTEDSIAEVRSLTDLAPLHQPQALRFIRAVRHLRPHLFQTGSFDTTFHATQSDYARRLAIPRALHDRGVKRYGFHGISYRYVARRLTEIMPDIAHRKVVIAHLGSGASLCAIDGGLSRDTSMGFSTLDGIPMATRPGWLDPGVLLHMLGPLEKSVKEVEEILYHQSGLLGVSGLSGDTRELLKDHGAHSDQAIELFTFRIAGEICRLASTLGGLDAVVFTAGIGEHQPEIRARVAERLIWLGVELDEEANRHHATTISTPASRIRLCVIPTDEEQMIAEECLSVRDRH